MPISVEQIVNNLPPYYRIRLLAGKRGIHNTDISWVSVVEDYDTEKFKNINRIVLTSGMNIQNINELLNFVKNIHKVKGPALFINVGKYIKEIPEEVKEYCDEVSLPLYTIPWDVLMSDVAKDLIYILMREESKNLSVSELMQSIIFNTENLSNQLNKLSFYGFSDEEMYCPIIIKVDAVHENDYHMFLRSVKMCCERTAEETETITVSFLYNRIVTIIAVKTNKEQLNNFVKALNNNLNVRFYNCNSFICVGRNEDIYHLSVNFKRLLPLMNVAVKNKNKILCYDKMGMYKILSEVNDMSILKDMYNETMGRLIQYDKENNTDLTDYIKNYILSDGNVQTVANNFFVHRNTVNNKLNKIKEITQINPLTLDGKIVFSTAIKVSELYNLE